jgi:hypothetical protein
MNFFKKKPKRYVHIDDMVFKEKPEEILKILFHHIVKQSIFYDGLDKFSENMKSSPIAKYITIKTEGG